MKLYSIAVLIVLILSPFANALDIFTTGSVEAYRTDLETTLISPNFLVQAGPFELYGFHDQYIEDPHFYHGELMISFQPFKNTPLNKISLIAEQRWDKYAEEETSFGVKVKLW